MERAMSATAAMLLRSSSWLRRSACGQGRKRGGAKHVSVRRSDCC
jgi:hypothetical protein